MTPDQQHLAEGAVRRAEAIARQYASIFPEHDADIESAAYFGAVRAAIEYKPDLGSAWEHWSKFCITGEVRECLRSLGTRARPDRPARGLRAAPRARGRRIRATDIESAEDDRDDRAAFEARERFDRLIERLPPRHGEVCRMVYLLGMTPAEAGRALGLSRYRGCAIHQEAIGLLKGQVVAA